MTPSTRHPSSPYLKLPFAFDLTRLQADLARLEASDWIAHFNTRAYQAGPEAQWSCLPLRSVDGRIDHIMPLEDGCFRDTPLMQLCPYFEEVIGTFQCKKTSIRLMSLAPGGVIHDHRDKQTSLEDGITRIHIPIQTSPEVLFRIDGETVHFSAGDAWYLNASCLHGVTNHSSRPRIHLMLDCITNDWLAQVFRENGGIVRPPHTYPDPSITDENVLTVIAHLRAAGSVVGLELAAQLEALHAGAVRPVATPAAANVSSAPAPSPTHAQ